MRIALLGDIALVGKYDVEKNPAATLLLKELKDFLRGFDLVIANLESPLTARMWSLIPKSMHVRSSPNSVRLLNYLGVHAVSLANNHINDFGRRGIDETIAILEQNNIDWYGVDGRTVTVARRGERVNLSGFCCLSTNGTGYQSSTDRGVGVLTRDRLRQQLSADRDADAFSIFSCHWGSEHTHFPNPEHVALMHGLDGEGSFLIHGHHPHVIQGIEQRNDSLIAYSLGNCLFDDLTSITGQWSLRQTLNNKRSFVLAVEIENHAIVNYETVAFEDCDSGVVIREYEDSVERYSRELGRFTDSARYQAFRQEEMAAERADKFGRKDARWWLSRLNYYSIGSRMTALPRQQRYKAVQREFLAR